MSRSGPSPPASPKENFGCPARRLLLRLIEPRSVGRHFDAFALENRTKRLAHENAAHAFNPCKSRNTDSSFGMIAASSWLVLIGA
jgi:hypothetical protein